MLTSIWICALILFTGAEVACLIIDDMDPAIRYEGDWATKSDCDSGFGCLIFPDSSNNALDGTWHFAKWSDSSHRSFEYNFQGTEITIYGILVFQRDVFSDDGTVYSWNVSLDLSIDGDYKDQYHFTQPTEPPLVLFNYSTPVLKSSGLSDGIHVARVDLYPPSQFIFDFLAYTPTDDPYSGITFPWEAIPTDTSLMSALSDSILGTSTGTMPGSLSPSNSQTVNTNENRLKTGAVIGIVTSVVFLLALVLLLLGFWNYRRRQRLKDQSDGTNTTSHENQNGNTSNSTTELLPEGSNRDRIDAYPITSYDLPPRKTLGRVRESGDRVGEGPSRRNGVSPSILRQNVQQLDHPNMEETSGDIMVPDPQRPNSTYSNPPDNILSTPLVIPMPVNLSVAQGEESQYHIRGGFTAAPRNQQTIIVLPRGGSDGNGNEQDGLEHYTGPPPTDVGRTNSPSRSMTAPPPYMPPSRRGAREMDDES